MMGFQTDFLHSPCSRKTIREALHPVLNNVRGKLLDSMKIACDIFKSLLRSFGMSERINLKPPAKQRGLVVIKLLTKLRLGEDKSDDSRHRAFARRWDSLERTIPSVCRVGAPEAPEVDCGGIVVYGDDLDVITAVAIGERGGVRKIPVIPS